jgi:integrase/recombinase XerD
LELQGDDPLFIEVRKGGHFVSRRPLSDRAVHSIVTRRLRAAGLQVLGPHALRASFVTLALEGGAPLHIVQRAAGHADPRTTERYWRRKDNLDDNAVDYVKL